MLLVMGKCSNLTSEQQNPHRTHQNIYPSPKALAIRHCKRRIAKFLDQNVNSLIFQKKNCDRKAVKNLIEYIRDYTNIYPINIYIYPMSGYKMPVVIDAARQ